MWPQKIILIEINMYTGKLNKTFKDLIFIRTYLPTVNCYLKKSILYTLLRLPPSKTWLYIYLCDIIYAQSKGDKSNITKNKRLTLLFINCMGSIYVVDLVKQFFFNSYSDRFYVKQCSVVADILDFRSAQNIKTLLRTIQWLLIHSFGLINFIVS